VKQLLLVAVLAALASSAITLLVSGAFRPAPPPAAGAPSVADFKSALADLEREVAAMRRESAERGSAVGPSRREESGAGRAAVVNPGAARGPGDAPAAAEAARTPEASASHLQRFREIFPRDENGDTSARKDLVRGWLLHGEAEVLEWFGLPDSITTGDGLETWYYDIPTGGKDEEGNPLSEDFQIQMGRGRVIGMDG
jgi:hypothetical protein